MWILGKMWHNNLVCIAIFEYNHGSWVPRCSIVKMIMSYGPGLTERNLVTVRIFFLVSTTQELKNLSHSDVESASELLCYLVLNHIRTLALTDNVKPVCLIQVVAAAVLAGFWLFCRIVNFVGVNTQFPSNSHKHLKHDILTSVCMQTHSRPNKYGQTYWGPTHDGCYDGENISLYTVYGINWYYLREGLGLFLPIVVRISRSRVRSDKLTSSDVLVVC